MGLRIRRTFLENEFLEIASGSNELAAFHGSCAQAGVEWFCSTPIPLLTAKEKTLKNTSRVKSPDLKTILMAVVIEFICANVYLTPSHLEHRKTVMHKQPR